MKRIKINSIAYKLLTLAYSLGCLTGLIFQVVEISNNFFKFDVVSDIKLINVDDEPMAWNICFQADQLMNKTIFSQIMKEKYPNEEDSTNYFHIHEWTMEDVFKVAFDPEKLFVNMSKECLAAETFITYEFIASYICYQVNSFVNCYFEEKIIENVQTIFTSLSESLPYVTYDRYHVINPPLIELDWSTSIELSHHQIILKKLPLPYVEDCVNYPINQLHSKQECYANLTNKLDWKSIIRKSDEKYLNMTHELSCSGCWSVSGKRIDENSSKCERINHNTDCTQNTVYTTVRKQHMKSPNLTMSFSILLKPQNPSFSIESKPRIDNIDYFSFVLGTIGAWLGVSALSFNPVPLFVVSNEYVNSAKSKSKDSHVECKKRMTLMSKKNDENLKRIYIRFSVLLARKADKIDVDSQ